MVFVHIFVSITTIICVPGVGRHSSSPRLPSSSWCSAHRAVSTAACPALCRCDAAARSGSPCQIRTCGSRRPNTERTTSPAGQRSASSLCDLDAWATPRYTWSNLKEAQNRQTVTVSVQTEFKGEQRQQRTWKNPKAPTFGNLQRIPSTNDRQSLNCWD